MRAKEFKERILRIKMQDTIKAQTSQINHYNNNSNTLEKHKKTGLYTKKYLRWNREWRMPRII